MLKREITKLGSYATLVGMMVGAGIFVAIGEAGRDAGPSTWLAYLLLGPVTLLAVLPYMIFQGTSLGNKPGGGYLHISRTFKNKFLGFIVMWLAWVTYVGVLATLAVSSGRYLSVFMGDIDPRFIGTVCLALFFIINLVGVKYFDRIQSGMFIVLLVSVALVVVPGFFYIDRSNFTPLMPNGVDGFLKALPILFFAYGGFDALSQTGGEVENPESQLPRVFFWGVVITMVMYISISLITFGVVPFARLAASTTPVADAATTYLPFGAQIVAIGALMAFFTTINACMLVPSRLLYAFAEDRVIPPRLARLNRRFNTPHLSLIVNTAVAILLVWTKSIGMLISIAMQATIIMYIVECTAVAMLPYANRMLWSEVRMKIAPPVVTLAGMVAAALLFVLYMHLPNPLNPLLIGWAAVGALIFGYERLVQNRRTARDIMDDLPQVMPPMQEEG